MFIAICVSLAALIGVIAVAYRGTRLTEVGGDILIAILGAMVAIIAGYVGREFNGRGRTDKGQIQPQDAEADRPAGSGLQPPTQTESKPSSERQGEGDDWSEGR
jgi:hypothetical protein